MGDEQRREPFSDDLCRSVEFTLLRAEPDETGDGLTIEGYGAVVNSITQIDSWEGSFDEVIAPGAFKKSLRERTPKMQFDHGRHPLLGSLPLGVWAVAEEDQRGLHLVGKLTDNWLVLPFREAIRDGGVEGMSFRFSVVRDEWTDKDGKKIKDEDLWELLFYGAGERGPILRTLKELKVSEAGPVVWPAYADTEVGVRSAGDGRRVVTIDMERLHGGQATELNRLARLVSIADRATRSTGPADEAAPETPDTESGAVPEPRTTDRSAGERPSELDAPPATDSSAGEHATATRPVNPAERSTLIKAEYRERLDRLMAIPHTDMRKDNDRG